MKARYNSEAVCRLQPARWTRRVARSALQDALVASAIPGVISFALGLPATELFPSAEYAKACADTLESNPRALQYGPPSEALKPHIVTLMRARGVDCSEEQIFLTSGAQQAVHLLVALLLDRGRQIIAEENTYPGFQQIVQFYEPEILTVSTDLRTGMDVEKVEWYLAQGARPAFIYAITDGHNPVGVSLSEAKRNRLLGIAAHYGVPILEEDPYGFLSYSARPTLPMRAQDDKWVFYVGSFSKILAPSTRVGWIVIPKRFIPYLAILKESSDIDMATFSQHVVARLLDSGFLPKHIDRLRSEYLLRRDVMLEAISEHFPPTAEWVHPECGVFIWVKLPEWIDTTRLLEIAATEYRVAFVPGSAFSIRGDHFTKSCMRLNFSHSSPQCIKEGMLRLSDVVGSVAAKCASVG